jgi:enamine deaminase RidA (YjgF/YER057c/UK114 family)
VLQRLGSRLDHVLRLRLQYVDPAIGPDVTRALLEAFPRGELPAITGVRVSGLVDPVFLIEIEADAVVADWAPDPDAPSFPEWDEGGD